MSKTTIRYLAGWAVLCLIFAISDFVRFRSAESHPYRIWFAAMGAAPIMGVIVYWTVVALRFGIAGVNERAEKASRPVEYSPRTYWTTVAIVSVLGVALAAWMQWGRGP